MRKIKYVDVLKILLALMFVFFILFPIVYLVITSVKPSKILMSTPPKYFFKPDFTQYLKIFRNGDILNGLVNSIVISTLSTIGALVISVMFSYGFVHVKFKWNKILLFIILITRMFPPVTTLIPVYMVEGRLGLADTRLGLILPYISFQVPLIVWIINEFMLQIPKEIEESAALDGCTAGQMFRHISVPLTVPGITAAGILAFIYNWNELMFAVTLTSYKARTLPVLLKAFTESEGSLQWSAVSAIGVITLIPIILFFVLMNKYLVKGLVAGAVKG